MSIIQKYNVSGPRYTSYPTVPYWEEESFSTEKYIQLLQKSFIDSNKTEGISLYIHLPFCENLCTFCGCHKRITKQHSVESPYIDAVLKEWDIYLSILDEQPIIKEIHLGGGTPTFFSIENLEKLINGIFKKAIKPSHFEYSFEGHPNNTTKKQLQKLFDLGFTRVSFGVQDYNPTIQKAINRIQPFENVKKVTNWAKEMGYQSISHDLIFGLPFQTLEHVFETIDKTKLLNPDRIAFYSYAHVPWIKGNGQRGFKDDDLPKDDEKRQLYELGKKHLIEQGYFEIGMDHFALPTDSMYQSFVEKKLHRNFMGYTSSKTQIMIGLGASSIGDCWTGFAQNEKKLEDYYEALQHNKLPLYRGHLLTLEDLIVRKHILNLMCHFETSWEDKKLQFKGIQETLQQLKEMEKDGLLALSKDKITVTEAGKPFVRNTCMAFDLRMKKRAPETKLFSMTV